jgi:hypothetical protein
MKIKEEIEVCSTLFEILILGNLKRYLFADEKIKIYFTRSEYI